MNDLEEDCCPHHPSDPIGSAICRDRGLCAPRTPKLASTIGKGRRSESVLPTELTWPVIAAAIEQAAGVWVDHGALRLALRADPDVLDRAERAAAAEGGFRTADLHLGNAVGQWSKAWTNGRNEYEPRFERSGSKEREYRYRLRRRGGGAPA